MEEGRLTVDIDYVYLERQKQLRQGLEALEVLQCEVSGHLEGALDATPENIRTLLCALHCEVAELGQEMGWKPWKEYRLSEVGKEHATKIAGEFADILAFLGLTIAYMRQAGVTPVMLVKQYEKKSDRNVLVLSAVGTDRSAEVPPDGAATG
jgi:hypothetical protein